MAGSAVLVYVLVWYGYDEQRRTNERLDRAIQQTSIFQRLLRHNLRNSCNVILGQVELLEREFSTDERTRTIKEHVRQLTEASDKSRYFREVALDTADYRTEVDLVAVVGSISESVRHGHPEVDIETDLPGNYRHTTDPRIERALFELVENAAEHNDRTDPKVLIGLRTAIDSSVEIFVEDNGPGLPEMERDVLEEGVETPVFHSQGLGLWISRIIVSKIGGTLRVTESKPQGSIIRITVP